MLTWLTTISPLFALILNVLTQIFTVRLTRKVNLSIVIGILVGFISNIIILLWGNSTGHERINEASFASILTYLALSFCFWAFLNLNLTSLRIRIVRELYQHNEGLSSQLLIDRYTPQEMFNRRMERLEKTGQIERSRGNVILRSRRLLVFVYISTFLNKLIIPREKSSKATNSSFHIFTWLILFSYILLLGYFNYVDVYNRHFFEAGRMVLCYNILRLFFIICLLWLFYALGDLILSSVCGSQCGDKHTLDQLLLALLAGIGAWHIALFCVGLAGFYIRTLLDAVTILVFVISLPRLDGWLRFAIDRYQSVNFPGILIVSIPLLFLMITKGLYPAGGHDYYTHYFHFYRKVAESGSILPNEVWYHFYYSKGAALFFMSMLLTDPLAPQLASMAMVLVGAGLVFSLLNRTNSWRLLPWLGVALYFAFLIYTPGPLENLRQGGWGDFEKPHEPAAVMMLAVIWLVLFLNKTKRLLLGSVTLALAIAALVLISPVMGVIAGAYLSIILLYFMWKRDKSRSICVLSGMFCSGVVLALVWLVNYLLTGVPDDQTMFVFWPVINFNKIANWGVLPEIMFVHWTKTMLVASQIPLTFDIVNKLISYLRLDVWWPLLLTTSALLVLDRALSYVRRAKNNVFDWPALFALGSFIVLIGSLSLVIGRDQPISFYRFTSFSYAPTLCFCLILLSAVTRQRLQQLMAVALFGGIVWVYVEKFDRIMERSELVHAASGYYVTDNIKSVLINGMKFARGKLSIADAYKNQQGWPGRMPTGGIYPAAQSVWERLPRHTRIWSMNVHSYCMLPDCHMEGFMSYRFSRHFENVYFGKPNVAANLLKDENLNYFFYSNDLNLTDPLPLAPLFSPDHIAEYFGIVWTDGESTLLTWKEKASIQIDKQWIDKYKKHVEDAPIIKSFPGPQMRTVLQAAHENRRVLQQSIPWYHAGLDG